MSNLDKVFERNRVTKLGIDAMITNYLRLEKELAAAQAEIAELKQRRDHVETDWPSVTLSDEFKQEKNT